MIPTIPIIAAIRHSSKVKYTANAVAKNTKIRSVLKKVILLKSWLARN
jgi:hypothetical protein